MKTNQKYQPVPKGKTAQYTNVQKEEPQIAVYTSKHVAIIRSSYNAELTGNLKERL